MAASARVQRRIAEAGGSRCDTDSVAQEVPIALVYNGIAQAVMLASPHDLEDFARGFSVTEGLVAAPGEIFSIEINPVARGIEIHLHIAAGAEARLKAQRRSMAGRTGCGLCGVASLETLYRPLAPVQPVAVAPAALRTALEALPALQPLRSATGAVHAAAFCNANGDIHCVREDVGRHNALDKLIGAGACDSDGGFILVTSRASFEMVQKTVAAGVGALVAVSAPTSLAISEARRLGLTLIGFASPLRVVTYV
jgi:FdhD protein